MYRFSKPIFAITLVAPVLLALAACGDDDDSDGGSTQSPGASLVNIDLREFEVVPDVESANAGEVTFAVLNTGEEPHEFMVVKTDLDPRELPEAEDGMADEEQLDVLAETAILTPGEGENVVLTLASGNYVLMCNLVETESSGERESHYQEGMSTAFSVE